MFQFFSVPKDGYDIQSSTNRQCDFYIYSCIGDSLEFLQITPHSRTYVTPAGCGKVIPVITFVLASDVHQPVYASGLLRRLGLGWLQNTIYTWGGHALTSPKGGGPCPLGTFNYKVAGHLAYRWTQYGIKGVRWSAPEYYWPGVWLLRSIMQ